MTGCSLAFTAPDGTTYLLHGSMNSSSLFLLAQKLGDEMSVEAKATLRAMATIINDALREPGES